MYDQYYVHVALTGNTIDQASVDEAKLLLLTRGSVSRVISGDDDIPAPTIGFDYDFTYHELMVDTVTVGKDMLLCGVLLAPSRLNGCPAVIGRIGSEYIDGGYGISMPLEWYLGYLTYPDFMSDATRQELQEQMHRTVNAAYMFRLFSRSLQPT